LFSDIQEMADSFRNSVSPIQTQRKKKSMTTQHSQLIIKCTMMLLTGVLILGDRYFVSADNLFHREPTTTFVVFKLDVALKIKSISQ